MVLYWLRVEPAFSLFSSAIFEIYGRFFVFGFNWYISFIVHVVLNNTIANHVWWKAFWRPLHLLIGFYLYPNKVLFKKMPIYLYAPQSSSSIFQIHLFVYQLYVPISFKPSTVWFPRSSIFQTISTYPNPPLSIHNPFLQYPDQQSTNLFNLTLLSIRVYQKGVLIVHM